MDFPSGPLRTEWIYEAGSIGRRKRGKGRLSDGEGGGGRVKHEKISVVGSGELLPSDRLSQLAQLVNQQAKAAGVLCEEQGVVDKGPKSPPYISSVIYSTIVALTGAS
jgi:hypothetical protein